MITFRGRRLPSGAALVGIAGGGALVPEVDDAPFTWGSADSGACALGRAILVVHLGARPSRGVAYAFTYETVANWTGDRWTLTSIEIDAALVRVRTSLQLTCLLCGDTCRREVAPGLWRACECRMTPPRIV